MSTVTQLVNQTRDEIFKQLAQKWFHAAADQVFIQISRNQSNITWVGSQMTEESLYDWCSMDTEWFQLLNEFFWICNWKMAEGFGSGSVAELSYLALSNFATHYFVLFSPKKASYKWEKCSDFFYCSIWHGSIPEDPFILIDNRVPFLTLPCNIYICFNCF